MTPKSFSSALLASLFASLAGAQTPSAGPGWAAYAGCWEPVSADGMPASPTSSRVCVVPTAGSGADLLTVADRKVTDRMHVEADGAQHVVARQGCAGWESATWSANGRRLYFNSEQTCEGGLQRKSTGIFAIATNGQWSNVVSVNAGGGQGLRSLRYASVAVDSAYPMEIVSALANRNEALGAARIAALTRLTTYDVIEAGKSVDASAVQAWLAAVKPRFNLDAKALVRLADVGVAPETIDVMVAVSNPEVFRVAATDAGASMSEVPDQPQTRRNDIQPTCYSNMTDPWGYDDYASCDRYRRFGYYRSRYGYGYDPFGYYSGYGYGTRYGGSTVVIVVKGSANDPQHGRMTKNGYVNTGSSTTTSSGSTDVMQSTRRTSASSGSSSTGSPSSGSSSTSGGSSSGGSSTSGSSTGRTAERKPPAR